MSSQRRGPWSQQEDKYLMQLVQNQGALNWVRISQMLGSRTPKQCRERYHQNLKPSLNHDPITPEEGVLIEGLVETLGKRWAEIARRLHNRSDNAVKNWWNGSMNRRRRMIRRKQSGPFDDANMSRPAYATAPPPLRVPSSAAYSPYNHYSHYPPSASPTTATARYGGWSAPSGLPSPSTTSPGADSLTDGPPSMVSESGSCFSTSPRSGRLPLPDSPVDLPPLRLADSAPSYSKHSPKLPSLFGRQDAYTLPPMRDLVENKPQLPTAPNSPTDGTEGLPSPTRYSTGMERTDVSASTRTLMKVDNFLS